MSQLVTRNVLNGQCLDELIDETCARRASTRPLNVLMVSARFAPLVGGTETHTQEVAQRLVDRGHTVTVLTTDTSGELPRETFISGVRVIRVRAYPRERDYYLAPALYRVISQGNWDIVHCQGYHSLVAPLAMIAALRSGVPYVVSFHSGGHSSRLRTAIRGFQRRLLRPLLVRATKLIAVSRFEVDVFGDGLGIPRDKFVVIPNGSNLPKIDDEGVHGSPVDEEETLILSVGRLERYKGHHRLISALPYVLDRCPSARLRIAGSGPYEQDLRELAEHTGVAGRVEIGSIASSDRGAMARLVAGASLVALLSDYEAHPVSVVEALALGRPVLVAYAAGCAELADDGLVRSIPLTSTDRQVADAILEQLENPIFPSNVEMSTWDACAADIERIYRESVPQQPGQGLILESSNTV